MVSSPSSSPPPPKWNSNRRGSGTSGNGQLLQELEALSHALYQSQKKAPSLQSYASQPSPQTQPQPSPVKKHSFLFRKDAPHSGRRLSHEPASDQQTIPFSSLPPHDPPPSFASLLSRHSLSSAHAPPPSFEQQNSATSNSRGRFSSSVVSSQTPPAWGDDKSEIRSRKDRRVSLPKYEKKSTAPQEQQDWPEDSLELSRRFDSSSSDKKKSVWSSWKPLRALSHLGRQRLHCVFAVYVDAIEGLPPAMNGLRLCVHFRKEETKEGAVQTMPSRVFQGIAEFQETLFMKCTLYGNKGPSNAMKFMEKAFIVSVIAPDIDELDFGRHQLDLSRVLGGFMEERNGTLDKGSSWDTTLDLTGKAKGGKLAITFNYEILDKDSSFTGNVSSRFRESPPHRSSMHTSYSLPNSAHGTPRSVTTRAHLSHSPSVSEPGNDFDDLLAMDQLTLEEPPPAPKVPSLSEAQQMRGGHTAFPSQPDRMPLSSQGAYNEFSIADSKWKAFSQTDHMSAALSPLQSAERVFEEGTAHPSKEEDEEEDEFVVVDQGMEFDDSANKHEGNIVVVKELDQTEEEISEELLPHVVEMDTMDDLPQVIDIEALDDPPPEVVDMEAFEDLPPHVEMQAFDNSTQSLDDIETLDVHSLQEASSQASEKEDFHGVQGHENDEERSLKEGMDGERQQAAALAWVESSMDGKEVQEDAEKNVTVDEGQRKDNVTYVMVMQTLDSLLQGTSAKESQREEKVEVEASADGIFIDEEDAADKDASYITSLSKLDKGSTNIVMEVNADVYEDDGCDSAEFKEKARGGKDNEKVSVNDISPEEEGGSIVWEAENRSPSASEKEDLRNVSRLPEEEKKGCLIVKEDGSNSLYSKEEEGCIDFGETEKGSDGFEGGSGYKDDENDLNHSEAIVTKNIAGEESVGMRSNADIHLLNETSDSKSNDAVFEDRDNEVDLVAGEFLDMLGMGNTCADNIYDSELDSPRARLLKEFEEEAFLDGDFGLNFDVPESSSDGSYRVEDAGSLPTGPLQELDGKDLSNQDQPLTLMVMEKEPAFLDQTLSCKHVDKDPSFLGLSSVAVEREPAFVDQTLGCKHVDNDSENRDLPRESVSKAVDMDLASWARIKALKGMEKPHVNIRMEQKPNDINRLFSREQVDKEPARKGHASALQSKNEEPPSWDCTLALKETDIEPVKLDCFISLTDSEEKPTNRGPPSPSQQMNPEPSLWGQSSASKDLEKEPMRRAPELPSNVVEREPSNWELEEDEELISFIEAAESELQRATQNMQSKSRAKMLEDAETEALMQEWGLNEKAFVSSPPKATIRHQESPPLGKGLGATVPLKDGGSLRSMNLSLFQANKNNGKLVMQLSKPIVVPAEMGTETADILRNMASMGIESMAVQAMTAMPLEDITGRSVEQVATEGMPASKSGHPFLQGSTRSSQDTTSCLDSKSRTSSQNIVDDFVSLEDIAPMAMQQIEALAIDGLKIQADVTDDDAPLAMSSFSLDGECGARGISAGDAVLKGVTGVHLSKGSFASTDASGDSCGTGLMGMSISLNEWMLLDAGLYDEAETKKDAMAIMNAHHAAHHHEMVVADDDEKRRRRQGSKNTGTRWGCMGNTLTIAMLVQLRDPLKNNEAVGAPMIAFVQAERMMKPPKMKVGRNVAMKGNSNEDEEGVEEPQFKITGVHMSGLKASQEEKKISWGNQKQLQSGSRWLIANGMTKNAKMNKPMLGSKPAGMASASASATKANANKGESLWSISSRVLSSGLRWRDKLKFNGSATRTSS